MTDEKKPEVPAPQPRDESRDGVDVVAAPKWVVRQVMDGWFEFTFSHPRLGWQRFLMPRGAAQAFADLLAKELTTPLGLSNLPPKDSTHWN